MLPGRPYRNRVEKLFLKLLFSSLKEKYLSHVCVSNKYIVRDVFFLKKESFKVSKDDFYPYVYIFFNIVLIMTLAPSLIPEGIYYSSKDQ